MQQKFTENVRWSSMEASILRMLPRLRSGKKAILNKIEARPILRLLDVASGFRQPWSWPRHGGWFEQTLVTRPGWSTLNALMCDQVNGSVATPLIKAGDYLSHCGTHRLIHVCW